MNNTKNQNFKSSKTGSNPRSGSNYVSYFNRIPGLNSNAANISFYNPVGLAVGDNFFGGISGLKIVPGIMRIGFVPGPGYASSRNDAANVAAKGIVAYITSNIGRSYTYDPQDFTQMLFAYESCILHLVKLSRAIGISELVSDENRYIPEDLLYAIGFNKLEDLPKAKWNFNYYANQLNKINFPDLFTNYKWHTKLLSKVIRDSDNLKSQLYVLDSEGYYIYSETEGKCKFTQYPKTMGLAEWITIMDSMLNPLIESETVGHMSSDIKNAFRDNLYRLPMIENQYLTPIDKDDELLELIHNITLNGSLVKSRDMEGVDITSLDITQDIQTSTIVWTPTYSVTGTDAINRLHRGIAVSCVLDMKNDNPSQDNVLLATRGKATVRDISTDKFQIFCGTEFFTVATIYIRRPSETTPTPLVVDTWTAMSLWSNFAKVITAYDVFDWSPRIMITEKEYTGGKDVYTSAVLGEIRNYTFVSDSILERITEGALASVYNIPQIGIIN